MNFRRTGGLIIGAALLITGVGMGISTASAHTPNAGAQNLTLLANEQGRGIKYQANGGEGSMPDSLAPFIFRIVQVDNNTFRRDHYDFNGWNTQADGSGESYQPGKTLTLKPDQSWATLYAQWTPKNYSITYDPNGGTNRNGSAGIKVSGLNYGRGTIVTDDVTPKRPGFVFAGWSWTPNVFDGAYLLGQSISGDQITGDRTLYALWKKETYTLTFERDGGVGGIGSKVFSPGDEVVISNAMTPKRNYDVFGGWSWRPGYAEGAYRPGDTIPASELTGNRTLYAIWFAPTADSVR